MGQASMRVINRLAVGGTITGGIMDNGSNTSMLNTSGFSGGGGGKKSHQKFGGGGPETNLEMSMTQQVAHFDNNEIGYF
jgi:hypothetical protein